MSRIATFAVLTVTSLSALSCTGRPQQPQQQNPAEEPTGECSLVWREPTPSEAEAKVVAPFSLTAQDGTGLELISVKSRAVVEDPLAFTELRLTFHNPQARQIEGNFEITLPPGAAISRFAMRQGDRWQEGEVVERWFRCVGHQAALPIWETDAMRSVSSATVASNAASVPMVTGSVTAPFR